MGIAKAVDFRLFKRKLWEKWIYFIKVNRVENIKKKLWKFVSSAMNVMKLIFL